jgi:hypothetical protein
VVRAPITGVPIYVGKGIWDRAYKHRFQDSAIGAHIRELVSQGLKPSYDRIPVPNADEAYELEELLVDVIGRRDIGTGPLFNMRPGGRKVIQSDAAKAKISAARIGKPLSEAHKAAVAATLTGRKQSEELKARHSIRMKKWWADRKSTMDSRS